MFSLNIAISLVIYIYCTILSVANYSFILLFIKWDKKIAIAVTILQGAARIRKRLE